MMMDCYFEHILILRCIW